VISLVKNLKSCYKKRLVGCCDNGVEVEGSGWLVKALGL
jgi:hypothetical protein